ncbi:ArnT family glycosyltransferase [Sinomicrobium sp. M5D2P17]
MLKKLTSYPLLLLAFTGILVFLPTFFNDFQREWDDTWQLLENPYVLDSSWGNIKHHFMHFYGGQYSPVNTLVYIGIYNLFGFNPTAFHAMCLGIHILNVFIVFYIIRDIVGNITVRKGTCGPEWYGFFVSLLFAIHPLQVEPVAWISASKVILYTFFALIAFFAYIKYIHTYKWKWSIVIAITYTLSFGSKEQAIILPLNLLAFDFIYGRLKDIKLKKNIFFRKVFLEKIPFFFLAFLFWYFSSSHNLGTLNVENTYPLYQRLLLGMHSLTEYIFRTIVPVKLYYYYFSPIRVGEKLPLFYWGYPILTLIIGGFIWSNYKKNNRLVIFGALFFFINILLVLHLIPMPRGMITADRYMYMSIIGLALILVWYIDHFYTHYIKYRKYIRVFVPLYILFLSIHTFYRTMAWKNSDVMKSNVLELIERRKVRKQPIINNPLESSTNE